MTIHYTTKPKTFAELADSVRGQLERMREVAITNEELPLDEHVVITSESFLDTLEQIEQIQHALWEQTEINRSIQQLFLYLFEHMGIDIDEIMIEDDEEE